MPTGVRMPVVNMSMRFLIGIVQALVCPGRVSEAFISLTSSSQLIVSGHSGRSNGLTNPGRREEYQRGFKRHCGSGFKTTTVSIIENGAGSVEVSARPAFPKTRSTSGN